MRLSLRFTVVVGASAALLFGIAGALQLRSEERDLQRVARSETLLLARALQIAFENAIRDRQIEDVVEILEALERVDPNVALFVFDEDGQLVGVSHGATPSSETYVFANRAGTTEQLLVDLVPAESPRLLRVGSRLREETPTNASSIVLEKPLLELRRDLAHTRRDIVLAVLFFVFAVAALTWLLTRTYVGLPLAAMIDEMRRVRAGKRDIGRTTTSNDEVGDTQRAFLELVQDLADTERRADQELEARQRIERGLQDADKLITLGQLSAVLAHEIGSPLQVVEGRARSMLKRRDPETVQRVVPMIIEQTERITRIVQQMLSITRRRPPNRNWVDAESATRTVVELLELEGRRRDVRLRLTRSGNTLVWADGDELQQIVLNLVRNALQAAPRGTEVHVRLTGEDDQLVIEVEDRGSGVSEEDRPKLFDPFFTTRSAEGGAGLGLCVVRTIVLNHGGNVNFAHAPVGARVRVVLPKAAKER